MKRLILVFTVFVFTSIAVLPLRAQTSQSIEYGQAVTFEITQQNYEIPFQFSGKKNDVIVADMQPSELPQQSVIPILRLLNSHKDVLADSTKVITFYGAKLAFELPADDTYTLVATRWNGTTGTDEGDFRLYLSQAVELSAKQPATDQLSTGSHNNYYWVHQTGQPLTLSYRKTEGQAAPDIAVNQLADGGLRSVIALTGARVTEGQLLLPDDIDPIVISIGGIVFGLRIDQQSVSYELTIS